METTYTPRVSVILCFYNEERFIGEAIASVLAQDYEHWELILVDDGSTDGSPVIARHYAALHPGRIQYVHHPGHYNEGLGASRNLGITKTRGDYVAFIGADDVWLPGKLRCQLDIFMKTNVAVVLGASWHWRSWADTAQEDVAVPVGVEEGIYCAPQLLPALYPLGPGAAPHTSAMMVRRPVLDCYEFEASFRGIFHLYEDQAFLCKLYLREVVFVSAACHNKCRHRDATPLGLPVHESGKYHMVRRYYLQWFMAYLKLQRWRYRRVRALVRRAAMPYQEPFKYKLMVEYPAVAKALVARLLVKPLGCENL